MFEEPLQTGMPALRHARRQVHALSLARVVVDVEVFGFEDLEIQIFVLDLVPTEVLRRCGCAPQTEEQHGANRTERSSSGHRALLARATMSAGESRILAA